MAQSKYNNIKPTSPSEQSGFDRDPNQIEIDKIKELLNKVVIEKPQYLHKEAIQILDEEFEEFAPKPKNGQAFFNIYNTMFYDFPKWIHQRFLQQSQKHAGIYIDPTISEINRLKKDKAAMIVQIDSQEQHHPFFKNGSILIKEAQWNADPSKNQISSEKYYIQSGKARRIPWDYATYMPIRKQLGFSQPGNYQRDEDYCIKVPASAIAAMPVGPPLNKVDRLYISTYEVNTYNGTYYSAND